MLTRRSLLRTTTGLTGLAALGSLAGCGEDSAPAASGGGAGSDAGADAGAFPRTVQHELGETRLDAAPGRVVCGTDGAELCSLLALGVTPVGFGQRNDPLRPWVHNLAADIDTYDLSSGETSYEALAAWAPDVILVQDGFATPDTMPRFTEIAPTLATSFIDWRANLRQVAAAVGLDDRAATLESDTDAGVTAIAESLTADHGEQIAGLRVRAVTAFADGSVYALNDASPLGKICAALGMAALPAARDASEAVDQLSLEEISRVDGDVLLLLTFDHEEGGNDELTESPLFQRLDVVTGGKVIEVGPDEANQLYFDSVLTVVPNAELVESYVRQSLA